MTGGSRAGAEEAEEADGAGEDRAGRRLLGEGEGEGTAGRDVTVGGGNWTRSKEFSSERRWVKGRRREGAVAGVGPAMAWGWGTRWCEERWRVMETTVDEGGEGGGASVVG